MKRREALEWVREFGSRVEAGIVGRLLDGGWSIVEMRGAFSGDDVGVGVCVLGRGSRRCAVYSDGRVEQEAVAGVN